MTTAVSSSRPWGRISPKNFPSSPASANSPPANPRLAPLTTIAAAAGTHSRAPNAKAEKATWMLLTVTSVANCDAGSDE